MQIHLVRYVESEVNSALMDDLMLELINAIRRQDDNHIALIIYRHFKTMMMRAMRNKSLSETDSEDAFQNCMVRLIAKRSIYALEDFSNFAGWLWRIASNEASDYMNKQNTNRSMDTHHDDSNSRNDAIPEPDVGLSQPDYNPDSPSRNSVLDCISSLRDRAVVKLNFGFEPANEEWDVLAQESGRSRHDLETEIEPLLLEISEEESKKETAIITRFRKHQRVLFELKKRMSDLHGSIESGSGVPESTLDEMKQIESLRAAAVSTYKLYREAQQYKLPHIPAKRLASILNMEENAIHQIITRARRKLR